VVEQTAEGRQLQDTNLDETKMSLDGFDGGIGGRPANVLVVKIHFTQKLQLVKLLLAVH
jgi:hypothetical protein